MPVMDGFELLEKIKSDENLKDVPVVAYSASVMKEQKERIHKSQFAGLLIKPVNISDLYTDLTNNLPYRYKDGAKSEQSEPETWSNAEVIDLDGLIYSLDGSSLEKRKSFELRQPIGDIREFGNSLIQLGNDHNCSLVSDYGSQLVDAANNFNIEGILRLLKRYSEIVDMLKK
jgi:CheY-like chemotaxis protein